MDVFGGNPLVGKERKNQCPLQKEFTPQSFAQWWTAGDDKQCESNDKAACQRVDRPDQPFVKMKGVVEQKLNQYHKAAERGNDAGENKELSPADVGE